MVGHTLPHLPLSLRLHYGFTAQRRVWIQRPLSHCLNTCRGLEGTKLPRGRRRAQRRNGGGVKMRPCSVTMNPQSAGGPLGCFQQLTEGKYHTPKQCEKKPGLHSASVSPGHPPHRNSFVQINLHERAFKSRKLLKRGCCGFSSQSY